MEIYDISIVPVIIGLVQLFKMAGLKTKYAPFAAILLGLLFGVFYFNNSIKDGILLGLVFGLSASGLYSGGKHIVDKNGET